MLNLNGGYRHPAS
jgi:hypothetical protein